MQTTESEEHPSATLRWVYFDLKQEYCSSCCPCLWSRVVARNEKRLCLIRWERLLRKVLIRWFCFGADFLQLRRLRYRYFRRSNGLWKIALFHGAIPGRVPLLRASPPPSVDVHSGKIKPSQHQDGFPPPKTHASSNTSGKRGSLASLRGWLWPTIFIKRHSQGSRYEQASCVHGPRLVERTCKIKSESQCIRKQMLLPSMSVTLPCSLKTLDTVLVENSMICLAVMFKLFFIRFGIVVSLVAPFWERFAPLTLP